MAENFPHNNPVENQNKESNPTLYSLSDCHQEIIYRLPLNTEFCLDFDLAIKVQGCKSILIG